MMNWLRIYKFEAHLTAFTLMILTSIGLYITAVTDKTLLAWVLISVFALANILAMVIK